MNSDFDSIPIFDLDGVMDRVCQDRKFFLELFDIAMKDANSKLEALKDAIPSNDFSSLSNNAHSLKSTLGNLGAMRCHANCSRLELMGRNSDLSKANEVLSLLLKNLEDYKKEVEIYRQKSDLD